jgi:hypothetical protein
MLKEKDFIRYKIDGMKGRVTSTREGRVSLKLTDGSTAQMSQSEAAQLLEVWEGDPRTGDWSPIE